jgi:hypothetical protein
MSAMRESKLQAEYKARLRKSDGSTVEAMFQCIDDSTVDFDHPCRLVLRFENQEIQAAAGDYFAALDKVRLALEITGMVPLVNGVGQYRYPSGMARDMGSGLKVYRLRPGAHSRIEDLVETFGDDDLTEPCTVAEQTRSYEEWLKGPRK